MKKCHTNRLAESEIGVYLISDKNNNFNLIVNILLARQFNLFDFDWAGDWELESKLCMHMAELSRNRHRKEKGLLRAFAFLRFLGRRAPHIFSGLLI